MSQASTDDDNLLRVITAFNENGGNKQKAAEALGIPVNTYKSRFDRAIAKFPNIKPIKRTQTIGDRVQEHRDRGALKATQENLKRAVETIRNLEDRIAEFEHAAKGSRSPAEWTLPVHSHKKREHIPELLVSDLQLGEVVRAEETDAGYGYNVATFRQYYRHMIDLTIYLSDQHVGEWTFPGIIYERGGDTLSGGIHDELKETDEVTPLEGVEIAFEEEAAGINKLADFFGRVEVKAPGAAGNHDRNLVKPHYKRAVAHSYDRLVNYMLRREFRTDKRVTFQVTEGFDVYFPVYNRNVLLTHGDRMGTGGGLGFGGPAFPIIRGVHKVLAEQAGLGRSVHRVHHGHHHFAMFIPDFVLSNGCFPGFTEFGKGLRFKPSAPQQSLIYSHPAHGVVDYKPLQLRTA